MEVKAHHMSTIIRKQAFAHVLLRKLHPISLQQPKCPICIGAKVYLQLVAETAAMFNRPHTLSTLFASTTQTNLNGSAKRLLFPSPHPSQSVTGRDVRISGSFRDNNGRFGLRGRQINAAITGPDVLSQFVGMVQG